jgi:ribosomal protein L34E
MLLCEIIQHREHRHFAAADLLEEPDEFWMIWGRDGNGARCGGGRLDRSGIGIDVLRYRKADVAAAPDFRACADCDLPLLGKSATKGRSGPLQHKPKSDSRTYRDLGPQLCQAAGVISSCSAASAMRETARAENVRSTV